MSSKRKRLKKLASLSALGAGAVALSAPDAQAGIVYFDANVKIGFDGVNGFLPGSGPQNLPGGAFFSFHTYTQPFSSILGPYSGSIFVNIRGNARWIGLNAGNMLFGAGSTSTYFYPARASVPVLSVSGAGATWSGRSGRSRALVGGRSWGTVSVQGSSYNVPFYTSFGICPCQQGFALFQFGNPLNPNYGWVRLAYDVNPRFGPDGAFGPNLRIVDFAYESEAGVPIEAGAAPEPATLELSGLAALVLGAEGIRRWRKARKAA